MALSIKELERLKQQGKIRDYQSQVLKATELVVDGKKVVKHWGKKKEERDWLFSNVLFWANSKRVKVSEEKVFHPTRKWKFDLFLQFWEGHLGIGIEWEGLNSQKSRHTTLKGYSGDCDKYNAAAIMGITVLRYTILNHNNVISNLNELYEKM